MKIIKPSATLMEHNVTPYEFIEKVGRTCYKSEDFITDGSAERFVANLVKREHMAMLEHETLYFVVSNNFMFDLLDDMEVNNERLEFFNITILDDEDCSVISGSFRSFYDLFSKGYVSRPLEHLKEILKFDFPIVFGKFEIAEKYLKDGLRFWRKRFYSKISCVRYGRTDFIYRFRKQPMVLFKHLTHTFKFVCDRGVTHEFVRHRVASFAQESTRYCNYSRDKFGNEITVIDPCFWSSGNFEEEEKTKRQFQIWHQSCLQAESDYFALTALGATPQEARTVLPNSLKTELIVTATEEEWNHIVNLRYLGTTGAPHPQIKEVMGLAITDLVRETNERITVPTRGE